MNLMFREPRIQNEKHLAFIRTLSCVSCGDNTSTEAAHVRSSRLGLGKRHVGKGEKPSDIWTVPLCGKCHREQHEDGELVFWERVRRDPVLIALALWAATGNHEIGEQIVRAGVD